MSRSYWVRQPHSTEQHGLAEPSFIQIIPGSVYVNGEKVQYRRGPNCVIDTGTTVIIAPPKDAEAFWAQVPGSAPYPPAPAYYTYPCASPPEVAFSFGSSSTAWSISPSDMNLGRVSAGSDTCVGALVGQDCEETHQLQ